MKTIIWGNYKGGVGKTTSAFQVATYFAEKGKKVLMIDLDPQCSLSEICCKAAGKSLSEYKEEEVFNYVIELYTRYINSKQDPGFTLLSGQMETPIKDRLKGKCVKIGNPHYENNLFFIPSSLSTENFRINELASKMEKNMNNIFFLQLFINDLQAAEGLDFDYLFIDCPPASNILVQSGFLASDYYIVPTIGDNVSTNGVADYITEIGKTRLKYEKDEQVGGVLFQKIFKSETKLVGIFETMYKERRGELANKTGLIDLDKNITEKIEINSLLSEEKNKKFRYSEEEHGFSTEHIFKYYIPNRDNRTSGESIPVNTSRGCQTPSYKEISEAILEILENANE